MYLLTRFTRPPVIVVGPVSATVTVQSAGELGLQPFFRREARPTAVRLVTVSRDGQLQGFAQRFEPVPAVLGELPGHPAVP